MHCMQSSRQKGHHITCVQLSYPRCRNIFCIRTGTCLSACMRKFTPREPLLAHTARYCQHTAVLACLPFSRSCRACSGCHTGKHQQQLLDQAARQMSCHMVENLFIAILEQVSNDHVDKLVGCCLKPRLVTQLHPACSWWWSRQSGKEKCRMRCYRKGSHGYLHGRHILAQHSALLLHNAVQPVNVSQLTCARCWAG